MRSQSTISLLSAKNLCIYFCFQHTNQRKEWLNLEKKLNNCWLKFKAIFKNPKVRILLDFCIITLIGVIIFRNFLFSDGWPAGGDALGITSRAYIFGKDFRWLYVWRHHSFGFVELVNGYDFFLMIIHLIFRNAIATGKALLFLTFIVSGFSSYTLAYWYTKNTAASLAAALIYTLNQWLFTQYTEAHGDILFSYALAPFVFLLIFRVFETGKLKDITFAALALAIFATAFHPEAIVIYGASFPIFAITYVLMPRKNNGRLKELKTFLKLASILVAVSFVLSTFVFLPMFFNVRPTYYSVTFKYALEESFGGVHQNLMDAFALGAVEKWGYEFAVDVVSGVALPDFPAKTLSLILFTLAYFMVFIRRDKYTVFFVVSAFVSMFIAKGINPPFGYVYYWAWFNVPYFAVFRAANRWVMMACLSHAFLTAALVDVLTKYVSQKKFGVIKNAFSTLSAKIGKSLRRQNLGVPLKTASDFFVSFHKASHYLGIILLIAIYLNGFISTWYFFQEGLQVYYLPKNYVKPYEWLGLQSGDFKVISVNKGPGRWRNESTAGFDFGYNGMATEIGWVHDIGVDSSFIHDHPMMQDGGWDPDASHFVRHLRFSLTRAQKSRDFLRIVGLFNYKYVVLPAYLDSDIREFFLNQTGVANSIIYDEGGAQIIQNPYYTPRFFAVYDHANILGGFESFSSLCEINTFDLNQTAFLSVKLNEDSFEELQNNAVALVFVNSDILDLTMLQQGDKAKIIKAAEFGFSSDNSTRYWVQSNSWRDVGTFLFGEETLTTCGNLYIDIPFEIQTSSAYEVWLRIGFLSYRGKLTVLVDANPIGTIKPQSDYWSGLFWVKINNLDMKKGRHTITLANDGSGFNDVDAIAIVEPSFFQSTYDRLLESLETFQGRIVDIIGAPNLFAYDLPEGWTVRAQQYSSDLLKAEDALTTIQESTNTSASSVQEEHFPSRAVDGLLGTRWASDPAQETPQWLQIEYSTVQEVEGVRIIFETAYAKDYTIQTWSGTQWILQANVTENTSLILSHFFKEPIKTTKLLLNVTAYGTPYHLVSIFEFEPCKLSLVTASHFIPRQGRYIAALRLASGPGYGTLKLKIGNYSLSVNCSDIQEKFQWYETDPLILERGKKNISISANGKILFDQMAFYSLKENENESALQSLFDSNSHLPTISFEKINPTAYKLHIKTERPFFLIFSEAYDSFWKARFDDGQEIQSIAAYFLINSFYINRTGEFDIQVFFDGQTYADIGLKISISSLILVSAVILMPKNVALAIKKRIVSWRRSSWLLPSRKK